VEKVLNIAKFRLFQFAIPSPKAFLTWGLSSLSSQGLGSGYCSAHPD